MSSSIGRIVKCQFLANHGERYWAAFWTGCPSASDWHGQISLQMSRQARVLTSRPPRAAKSDAPHILSGVLDGSTAGAPARDSYKNRDARSRDYGEISGASAPPGPPDYAATVRYSGLTTSARPAFQRQADCRARSPGAVCGKSCAGAGCISAGMCLKSTGSGFPRPQQILIQIYLKTCHHGGLR